MADTPPTEDVPPVPMTPVVQAVDKPPIQQTPIAHKAVAQPFSMNATNTVADTYKEIMNDTKGHYFVGMEPATFLEKFLPWNETTVDSYKNKVPEKWRLDKLRSVPPGKRPEKEMYRPFVEALDNWVTRGALEQTAVPNPQTLRFLRTDQPDTSCEGLNVDVSTYWSDDFTGRTSFCTQQTHEEFKRNIFYDAFQHKLDEPREKGPQVDTDKHLNKDEDYGENNDEGVEDIDIDDKGEDGDSEGEDGDNEGEDGDNEGEDGDNEGEDDGDEGEEDGDEGGDEVDEVDDHAEATNDPENDRELAAEAADNAFIPDLPPEEQPQENPPPNEEDPAFGIDEAQMRRPSVDAGAETDTDYGGHTRGQIAAYAGVALSMAFRNHLFSMLILGQYARFIRWDRRGAIVSLRFDYCKRPELIFQFYQRYGQLSLAQRGFDPRVKLYKGVLPKDVQKAFGRYYKYTWYGGAKFSRDTPSPSVADSFFRIVITDVVENRKEAFFIPAPRYRRASLFPFCRATRRSLACPTKKRSGEKRLSMCFLKDSWQEVSSRTASEADIYRILKEKKVRHVASMRLGGDVKGLQTETQNWFSKLSHNSRHRKLGKMVCHRLVLDTVARDLSTFSWCKVLLSCVADAVEAAQEAYEVGILHRDLSAGNIMIVRDKDTKEWKGVLIDWDMCLLWKDYEGEARTGRTGTWAFISARILLSPTPVGHTLWDDIESAFWVLVYQALRYLNHDLNPYVLYSRMQLLFSYRVLHPDGSVIGGYEKETVLVFCSLKKSTQKVAQFEVTGLNQVLEELATIIRTRYDTGEERPPLNDRGEPDENWFPALLRKAALAMEPHSVTPTGLKSPTNDSKPPADSHEWQPATLNDSTDYTLMLWEASPVESSGVRKRQVGRVSRNELNHLDGLTTSTSTSKRRHISEPEDENAPLGKKQRKKKIHS